MANHLSSKQRIRRNARRARVNGARKSRVHTFVRKLEAAIASGDKKSAQTAFQTAESEIRRAVSKGVFHLNTASRRISRFSDRIKALSAS